MDDYLKEQSRIEIKDSPEPGDSHVQAPAGLPPQYEIIEEIGHGGMGTVYKARHSQLGTYVAVKVINTDLLEGKNETKENAQKRFVNESKAVSQLQQENVIALKDYGVTAEGSPFMIMEYAEGKTLDTMVKGGPMEYKSVLNIMRGVCDGLEHAHAIGLVHRDIKPSNIIVTRSAAGREIPKLLDFGIARITGEDGKTQGLTSTGEVFGSPYCIAPEQSLSSKVDRRADIYSLGCVLFECVTGKPPYAGDTAMHTIMMHLNSPIPSASAVLGKTLPPDLEFIINRCLQKDPNKRYQNAAALKADIDLLLSGKHLKRTALGGAASGKHIKAFVIMGAAAVAISAAGLMALFLVQSNPPAPNQTPPASGNLERDAYGVDVGEAYSAFMRGDYNRCIILQKGAIGVYDDRLEAISKEIAKGASGSTLRDLNNEETKLQCWKADNLKHIGDCYRLLSRNNEALSYYNKGLEIYRRWAFTGYKSNDLGECYRYAIEILQKLSRTDDAKILQQEYERYLHAQSGH